MLLRKFFFSIGCYLIIFNRSFALTTYTVNLGTDTSIATGGSGSGTSGDLRWVLNQILNQQAQGITDSRAIVFTVPQVTLGGILPMVNLFQGETITIGNAMGSPVVIDGAGTHRAFFVRQGNNVTLQNLTIQNTKAKGGNGGIGLRGGGGGMGAGGALFVDAATVTLIDVSFLTNAAQGGNGGSGAGIGVGGGGGLGGDGGNGAPGTSRPQTGGGGYSGRGGDASGVLGTIGGGGGGFADGGNAVGPYPGGGGGAIIGAVGGSGMAGNGGTVAGFVFGGGGAGGSDETGSSGGNGGGVMPGLSGGPDGGGGGGGFMGTNGGNLTTGTGGNGGIGGGGGAACEDQGTTRFGGVGGAGSGGGANGIDIVTLSDAVAVGGYGGGSGAGGAVLPTTNINVNFGGGSSGGAQFGGGGFGGGGGGNQSGNAGRGAGGFGGGGGADPTTPGTGGQGAGSANTTTGGGGGGLGGAIFVNALNGGSIVVQSSFSTNGNTNASGTGANSGAAVGQDLFVATGGAAASLTLSPGSNETFTFNGSIADNSTSSLLTGQTYTQGSGAGISLTKAGQGTVVLAGTNTFAGLTTVSAGRLSVNGSILHGATIQSGGVLGGTGTVSGTVTVQSGGTLSPGNSIGQIDVGVLNVQAGGNLNIEITPTPFMSSLVHVLTTGNATIDPAAFLQVQLDPGTYTVGSTYDIITTTTGTINAPFTNANIISSIPGYTFSNALIGNMLLQLMITGTPSPTPPAPAFSLIPTNGLRGNNLRLANYLNSLANFDSIPSILNELSQLSPHDLKEALETISPARNATASFALQNTSFAFSSIIDERLASRRFTRSARREYDVAAQFQECNLLAYASEYIPPMLQQARNEGERFGLWITGFGLLAEEKSQHQIPHFDFNSGAGLIGFDAFGFEHAVIGISAGYAHINVDFDKHFGSQSINDYVASLYSTLFFSRFFLDAAIWGGYQTTESKRNVFFTGFDKTAHSRSHGWQTTPHLGLGYDILYDWGAIEPFAQFDWAFNFNSAISEHGASPLNMKQKAHTFSLLRSEVGLASFQTICLDSGAIFVIREKISYINKKPFGFHGVGAGISGAPGSFFVNAITDLQNLVSPGLELFYRSNSGAFISANYEGEFGSGYKSNSVFVKVGKEF